MRKGKILPSLLAVLAAALFGISTPLAKALLGDMDSVALAAFLYLGSGLGMALLLTIKRFTNRQVKKEASLTKKDIPWLIGAIAFGGVLAPIILLVSLQGTPASTASLLLNFECVATTLIALLVFKENIGRRVGSGIALITLASIILTWSMSNSWGFSVSALGILISCLCWGIDNNMTRSISSKNPYAIVAIKGIGAGVFSLCLSLLIGSRLPEWPSALLAMLLGFFSYGLSIVFFVLAMRHMGTARTSAFFGAAPFIGALLSFVLYRTAPDLMFIIASPIMIFGAVLLLKEKHSHMHVHEPLVHEHQHTHHDGHHDHPHDDIPDDEEICHSHVHAHEALEHAHPHMPDINHRHTHN